MKKIVIAGIVIFLVMFMVTCDLFIPDDEIVGYTDVEYVDSDTGSQITVYIDGSAPVPVTKGQQRAMTKNLAKMAYDFIEVIFISKTGETTLARTSWELGQSAGISGVKRGIDYTWLDTKAYDDDQALMFVGRKDGKTLLGIGRIMQVDRLPKFTAFDVPGTGYPTAPAPDANVLEKTQSVTFWVEPIKTGLLIKSEAVGGPTEIEKRVAFDSFSSTGTPGIRNNASRSTLGKSDYPLYLLPDPEREIAPPNDWVTYEATYTFGGAAETYKSHIVLYNDNSVYDPYVIVQKRFPRYLEGGSYRQPKSPIDTLSEVAFDPPTLPVWQGPLMGTTAVGGPTLNNVIPLKFTPVMDGAIFSFYIEIPVFMIRKTDFSTTSTTDLTKATNGGPDAEIWKIRTGLGSEFYSLDDGISSGGCVLMGIGVASLDWLEIDWEWVK